MPDQEVMFEAHISLSLSSFQATKQRLEKVRLLPGILFHSALSPSTDSHRKTKFSQLMDKVIISVGVGASTINMRNFIVNIYTHTHTRYTRLAPTCFSGEISPLAFTVSFDVTREDPVFLSSPCPSV